jgi:hypothetical protein
MMGSETINVIYIKWGNLGLYSADHVNGLYKSVLKNSGCKINFYCFTDDADNLNSGILPRALPTLKNLASIGCNIYQREVGTLGHFWPEAWCGSFKCHCLSSSFIPFLRRFKMARIPSEAKILCFHGRPKPEEAMLGLWSERARYKKLFYKHPRPVTWLENYLTDD